MADSHFGGRRRLYRGPRGDSCLVIGNAGYPDNDSPLSDPANDARDVADELTRDGFAIGKGINLTGEAMRQTLERLHARIGRGGIVLLFFDGFGIQTTTRQIDHLPVHAQIWAEADIVHVRFNLEQFWIS
ncbi:MAG TPA: caspase family protein [Bradyrhizobium sp.]|nr:caspase family protein [Bradyrhizobium sp.]